MDNNYKSDDFLEDSVAQFRDHQAFVQAHLKGTLNDEPPLLPAFFPPSSYWTSHEKDLFFHGLTIYSRFRPDLIAESIKSKNTLDVCLYLDILQAASSSIPLPIDESFRSSLEPAMEVSSRWIQNEERVAAALIHFDSCTWSAGGETNKSKNRCVCSPTSLHVVDYTESSSPMDHSGQTELKKSYLNHLDCVCLKALERIVREAQIGKVDPMTVSLSPTPESIGPPATQTSSSTIVEANLGSTESTAVASLVSKESDSSKLEAQRRLKKSIYMRHKRAQSMGKPVNTEAIRLPPGRQPKGREPSGQRSKIYRKKQKIALFNSSSRKESPRKPKTVADSEAYNVASVSTAVDELDQGLEPRSEGRLTKLRQMRNRFLEIGVNSQMASNNNLDIFNLSSLAQLMRIHSSLNDSTRPLNDVSISADTIQLLFVILTEFISEVIRGALISKEQEIRMKGNLKVWKYDQEKISADNVRETLKTMGIANSKKDFSELVKEINDDTSSPDPLIGMEMDTGDDDDGRGEDDNQSADEDETSNEHTDVDPSNTSDVSSEQSAEPSQALREFWLPESLRQCLLPKDIRESGRNDDLLPEINGIELERELEEEKELDARDLLVSKDFEAGLWGS